jgi:DNA polymerase III epsilon subunit-like protein
MLGSTDFCAIVGNYGFKWPKLQELHHILFKKQFEGSHDALVDVRACAKCYFELRKREVMQ